MTTMTYREYLESEQWQGLRREVYTRAGGKCEKCGFDATETHHTIYPARWDDDAPDNLQALCPVCHKAAHLEQKARKISQLLARETDPEKIYIQLLAWGVEFFKYSRG